MGPLRRILRPTTPVNQVARDSMAPTPQAPAPIMENKPERPQTILSGNVRDNMANRRPNGFMAKRGFGQVAVQRPAPAPQAPVPAPSPAPIPKAFINQQGSPYPVSEATYNQQEKARKGNLNRVDQPQMNTQGSPFPIPESLGQKQGQAKMKEKFGGLGYDPTGLGSGRTPLPQMGGGSPMNPNYVNPSPSAQKPEPFNEAEFYANNG